MAEQHVQPPLSLFSDSRLSDGDRVVYCVLLSFGDFGTLANCRPSREAIAKKSDRKMRAVSYSLDNLDTAGWIKRQHRPNQPSIYTFPAVQFDAVQNGAPVHGSALQNGARPEVHGSAPSGCTDLHTTDSHLPIAKTESHLPPAAQSEFALEAGEHEAPKLKNIDKALIVLKIWDAARNDSRWHHAKGTIDNRNIAVLATAYNTLGADGLTKLIADCATDDWRNGLKRPMTMAKFFAKDHLAETQQSILNRSTATVSPNAPYYEVL